MLDAVFLRANIVSSTSTRIGGVLGCTFSFPGIECPLQRETLKLMIARGDLNSWVGIVSKNIKRLCSLVLALQEYVVAKLRRRMVEKGTAEKNDGAGHNGDGKN